MVHCLIFVRCTVGFVRWVYSLSYKTSYREIWKRRSLSLELPIHYGSVLICTWGQFWPSGIVVACVCVCVCVSVCVCQSVCQSLACPRNNSGPVQAMITKFGPTMQKTLFEVPIFIFLWWWWWGQLTLTFKVKFNLKIRIYPILILSAPQLITHSS